MLDTIKLALRYRTDIFDDEINVYIQSCKNDLILGGVAEEKMVDADDSIQATAIAYCKWQLNFQGQGEKWEKIYKSLRTSIVLDSRYH